MRGQRGVPDGDDERLNEAVDFFVLDEAGIPVSRDADGRLTSWKTPEGAPFPASESGELRRVSREVFDDFRERNAAIAAEERLR